MAGSQEQNATAEQASADKINAFVLVARGMGANTWSRVYDSGELIGMNERFAYGYFHAEDHGCRVTYSTDAPQSLPGRVMRLGFRAILGFDLVHAWRNRTGILASDVVWTHTESQSLAVSLLLSLVRPEKPPKLILQTVWFMDKYPRLDPLRKRLWRWLLRKADILTFLATINRDEARELFPDTRCEFIPFGIPNDAAVTPSERPPHKPMRILSLGNDRHRDWPVLIEAFGNDDDFEAKILSTKLPQSAVKHTPNIQVLQATSNDELYEAYAWADVVVVPLSENKHASGITVVEEGVLRGVPVVATDIGGLRSYFSDEEIWYVPEGDRTAMRETVKTLANAPGEALGRMKKATDKMLHGDLNSRAYARRHAELSKELLER
ncbi:glycosyltransferase family 4 protein [Henriciella aquimarina]|uniref:glycosyltransferase family 4 protein n=1 Tax=Henriciella aquimarina TaxID=545261 RepID=UPI00117A7AE9|nr:glycosyltransferase family 4 protein [Henriciella aquimarina]